MTECTNRLIKIASCGVGLNSAAGLLLDTYDEIVFADPGSERPETYEYLAYLQQFFKITVIKSEKGNIYDYYFNKKAQPSMWQRDCTGKFKISPIRKYLREKYGKDAKFEMHIFIDYDEYHRMRESDVSYITHKYPLVERQLGRQDCITIIENADMKVPIKSGCYFCPFTTKKGWLDLKGKHPELWQKSLALEKNSTMNLPLINLKGKESMTLIECGCFNGNLTE